MHLFLACFWLGVAIVVQIFWESLEQHRFFPVSRTVVGFVCFVLFSYNFIRWRLARMRRQAEEELKDLPPRPRVVDREYNPELDFSKPDANKPKEDKKPDPPAAC